MPFTATRPAGTGARFVAYDRAVERVANPDDGTAMSFRAQTWIEEQASIKIATFQEKSSGDGFDTVYVHFDASSIPNGKMKHNFGASVEGGSALAARLKAAYESDDPVYVALETRRRKTVENTRDKISPQTPILQLRGDSGDGKGNPQTTKANCVKVIVAAGDPEDVTDTVFASEKDMRSDPAEWGQLRGNSRGDIAPDGWRCHMIDGRPGGWITNHVPPAGSDVKALASELLQLVQNGNAPARQVGEVAGVRAVRATEEKPWQALNSDNRPNAGGYLAVKLRETHAFALQMVTGVLAAEGAPQLSDAAAREHVWGLVKLLLWMGDQVQKSVLGVENRTEGSHREAMQWLQHEIATRYPYTPDCIQDANAQVTWGRPVLAAATDDFATSYRMLAEYLGVDLATVVDADETKAAALQTGETDDSAKAPNAPAGQAPVEAATRPLEVVPPQSDSENAAPTPTPAPAPASGDPEAVEAWKRLAADINMERHIFKLSAILAVTFGVPRGLLSEIDADTFKAQVAQWSTAPGAFLEEAKRAYKDAAASRGPEAERKAG